jgi:hypothetical protein
MAGDDAEVDAVTRRCPFRPSDRTLALVDDDGGCLLKGGMTGALRAVRERQSIKRLAEVARKLVALLEGR